MRCEDVQELLDRRALDSEVRVDSDVESHIQSCTECREFSCELELVDRVLASVPMETFSPEKSRQLKERISALEASRIREASASPWQLLSAFLDRMASIVAGPRLAYGLGTLAVLAICAVALRPPSQAPSPGPEICASQVPARPRPIELAQVKTHSLSLVNGDLLVSGVLLNRSRMGGKDGKIRLPEGRSLSTLKSSATVVLADGTKVALDGSTEIKVGDRELILARGTVAVHVKKTGRGFKTITPRATTVVLGTRYVADLGRVELVEGSIRVSGRDGRTETLKPGQQSTVGDLGLHVSSIESNRLSSLYRKFAGLDSKVELARDLGISLSALDATMNPTVPTVTESAAQSPAPSVQPSQRTTGPRLPMPGEFVVPNFSSGKGGASSGSAPQPRSEVLDRVLDQKP